MKFEKISNNIIKITLSLNDLEKRNIDFQSLTYNSKAAQELLWEMMEHAEDKFGFDISNSHIVFEPVSDLRKGFVITITKLDTQEEFDSIKKLLKDLLPSKRKTLPKRLIYPSTVLYSFVSLDNIVNFAKLNKDIVNIRSSLYKLNNTYYLLLKSSKPYNFRRLEISLSEFGKKIYKHSIFEGLLNERGTILIRDNAIEVMENHF